MRRIAIIGPGGAGKTTLARELGRLLGLEVIHLARLVWQPGWVEPDPERWAALNAELVARDAWVIDGNYGRTMRKRLERADTIVFLDTHPLRACARVLRRWLRYRGRSRPDLPEGCPERFDLPFLRWIWTYRRRLPNLDARLEEARAQGKRVEVLRTPRDVRRFLATVPDGRSPRTPRA